MVVKIPDPTSRTRPSAEPTSLPTIPSGGSSTVYDERKRNPNTSPQKIAASTETETLP